MKKAYYILKTKENNMLYGNEWLFTSSTKFTNTINVKLVAPVNGYVSVALLNAHKKIVAARKLITDAQEVYDFSLDDLNKLPAGKYTLLYRDKTTTKTIELKK
jgi:hypothetical protein